MTLAEPFDYLAGFDAAALIAAFSVSVLLDIPRYTFGFLAVLVAELGGRRRRPALSRLPSISVIIPGHNEAHSFAAACSRCASRPSAASRSSASTTAPPTLWPTRSFGCAPRA